MFKCLSACSAKKMLFRFGASWAIKFLSVLFYIVAFCYVLVAINAVYLSCLIEPSIPTLFFYSPKIVSVADTIRVTLKQSVVMLILVLAIGVELFLLAKFIWQALFKRVIICFVIIVVTSLFGFLTFRSHIDLTFKSHYIPKEASDDLFAHSFLKSIFYASTYVINLALADNFREVVPKKLYRSGEMSPEVLAHTLENYGINTVIDLRLGNSQKKGNVCIEEKQIVKKLGVSYFHTPLASTRVIKTHELNRLLDAFNKATPPILIHCSNGTHRSGFATLLWLTTREGVSFDIAVKQLSLMYGFFHAERAILTKKNGHPTQDSVVWEFLNLPNHSEIQFIDWLKKRIEF